MSRLNRWEILAMLIGVIAISWNIASKTQIYKDKFKPEVRNPNALLKIIREIPSDQDNNEGSKEIQIGNRKFIIPNKYIYPYGVKNERQNSMGLRASWPTMIAETGEWVNRVDTINIELEARKDIPRSASLAELDLMIRGHHGEPVLLAQYSDLQEYPNRNLFPFYRAKDASTVWADGLPAYFYCGGSAISLQTNGDPVVNSGRCNIQLTWPDSFNVNIDFDRSHLSEWRKIHDLSMKLLSSMELDKSLNHGTLLKNN